MTAAFEFHLQALVYVGANFCNDISWCASSRYGFFSVIGTKTFCNTNIVPGLSHSQYMYILHVFMLHSFFTNSRHKVSPIISWPFSRMLHLSIAFSFVKFKASNIFLKNIWNSRFSHLSLVLFVSSTPPFSRRKLCDYRTYFADDYRVAIEACVTRPFVRFTLRS